MNANTYAAISRPDSADPQANRTRFGPIGPRRKGLWSLVRLKRAKRRSHSRGQIGPGGDWIEVLKFDGRRWVSLGSFDGEEAAIEQMEIQVAIMDAVEIAQEESLITRIDADEFEI